MGLIDTHSHLYLADFDADREALISAAIRSGIEALLLPNIDETTVLRMYDLCDTHPDFCQPMMGIHPTSIDSDYVRKLKKIESYLLTRKHCAIGEIGIDLHWDKTYLKEQKIVFEEQLRWSIDLQLPVAIHTRDAFPEVLDSIYKVGYEKLSGIFHSFTGHKDELIELKKLRSFKIGINGVVTFKNAKIANVLPLADLKDLVLETDAPYLSPVPFRGRRNEPVYLWETAEKVASIYHLSVERIVQITRENASVLFSHIN